MGSGQESIEGAWLEKPSAQTQARSPDFGFSQSGAALPIPRELLLIYSSTNEIRGRSSAFRKLMHLMLLISFCVCAYTYKHARI